MRCYGACVSRLAASAALIALLFASSSASAADGIPGFYSARAVSIGGTRALASGTEAIFLNPGALGFQQQYILQLDYAHDLAPSYTLTSGDGIVLSLVDSKTNPKVPTGLSYRYVWLNDGGKKVQGSVYDFAIGAKILANAAIGLHLSYLSYGSGKTAPNNVSNITGDLGLLVPLGPVSFNVSGFNLIKVNTPDAPIGFDVGMAIGDGKIFRFGGDYSMQWPHEKAVEHVVNLGAEVLVANVVPVRFGTLWNTVNAKAWPPQYITGGIGLYLTPVGFDLSYRWNVLTSEGSLAFSAKLFI